MSLSKKPPCYADGKACSRRQVGCHSKCEEYITWSSERQKALEIRRDAAERERQIIETNIKKADRLRKRRRKR